MDRVTVRAAALGILALSCAGCSSLDLGLSDSPAVQKPSSAATDVSGQDLKANLDTEIRRAQLLRVAGDYPSASRLLGQLMLAAPDDSRVVSEYGKLLVQRGQPQDAVAFLKRAEELNPGDWMVFTAMGVAYDQMNDRASAQSAYEQALRLKPGEAAVLNNYGVSRMRAGDLAKAQMLLTQAKDAGSNDPKIDSNIAMVAEMREKRGEPVAAIASSVPRAKPMVERPMVEKPVKSPAVPMQTAARQATQTSSGVMMQRVPMDPLAGPVRSAKPATQVATAPPKVLNPAANTVTAAAKAVPGDVMMQRVPFDPQAGPVKSVAKQARKPETQQAAKPQDVAGEPRLRTAADMH